MRDRGGKGQAISWIEIDNKVHTLTVLDASHPLKETTYSALWALSYRMEGHAPLTCES